MKNNVPTPQHSLSSRVVLKAGVCVCVCECVCPVVHHCVPLSLEPLSEMRCDGWAEADPGIQAAACSSSVQSSVERDRTAKKKRKKP